jgi:hypothetical protein
MSYLWLRAMVDLPVRTYCAASADGSLPTGYNYCRSRAERAMQMGRAEIQMYDL